MKRIISVVLAVMLLCSMAVLPAGAVSDGFTDISDSAVEEAAETLRLLGIVEGTGNGKFDPEGTFTRAAFCKMVILASDRGGEAGIQQGRVIFSDVTSSHWALGYINAAATGTSPLIRGVGDGTFHPDQAITYGQAVTILMRALGYADTDVTTGGLWYNGYLTMADSIGLTEGLTLGGEDVVTRGEAAILFENMLFTKPKGGSSIYLVATLGGSVVEDALVLSITDTTLKTSSQTYKTERDDLFSTKLKGYTVDLILDSDGKVLTVRTDEDVDGGTQKTYILTTFGRTRVKTSDGDTVYVDPETEFWQDGEETTYEDVYLDLASGTTITFYYSAEGDLERMILLEDGLTVNTGFITSVSGSNPFSFLTGDDTSFTIFKNGMTAKRSDFRIYDVGSYNQDTGVLTVCDQKLTGIYEAADPTPSDPSAITVMGHKFSVLTCAVESLSQFEIGDSITLLLDEDNNVAGAVSSKVVSEKALGVVTSVSYPTVSVALTSGITVTGTASGGESYVNMIQGKLVTVTSSESGKLNVTRVLDKGVSITGDWNVKSGTLGDLTVSSGVSVYERVGDSKLFEVGLDNVTVGTVSADSITYARTDYAGRVDAIILEDVTGDCYSYGLLSFETAEENGGLNNTITVSQGSTTVTPLITGYDYSKMEGEAVGIVGSLSNIDGSYKLSQVIELTAITNVRRSAFGEDSVSINGVEYPLADDVKCYNAESETWFVSLEAARTYATVLTVYYDKPVAEGGKIRLVVVGDLEED